MGLRLGLTKSTLDDIEERFTYLRSRCLYECISCWLLGEDDAKEPTWYSLADAIHGVGTYILASNLMRDSELHVCNDDSLWYFTIL